jgi:hypothetical protein
MVKAVRCHQDTESSHGTQRAVVQTPEGLSSFIVEPEIKEKAEFCVFMKGWQ